MQLLCLQLSFFAYSGAWEPYCLQLGSFVTIGAFCIYNWSFIAYNGKVPLISTWMDCKQRSLTLSKKAPTVSNKAHPPNIYHHHPESKTRKSSEGNTGSIHPYGRYGNAGKTVKSRSTTTVLWPVKAIFEERAATVEVGTFIFPVSVSSQQWTLSQSLSISQSVPSNKGGSFLLATGVFLLTTERLPYNPFRCSAAPVSKKQEIIHVMNFRFAASISLSLSTPVPILWRILLQTYQCVGMVSLSLSFGE